MVAEARPVALDVSDYMYVDTASHGWGSRNHIQRIDAFAPNGHADVGTSYQRATVELVQYVATHRNGSNNPNIAGFEGPVWTPILPLDFDAEDPQDALAALRSVLDRLNGWGVPVDAVRLYFSGYKGFHAELPAALFGGFTPSVDLPAQLKRLATGSMLDTPTAATHGRC